MDLVPQEDPNDALTRIGELLAHWHVTQNAMPVLPALQAPTGHADVVKAPAGL